VNNMLDVDIKKKCIGCDKYFEEGEHDGSEIFICSACKKEYVDDEQKSILSNVSWKLRDEIKELACSVGMEKSSSGYVTYDHVRIEIDIEMDEMVAKIAITDFNTYNYDMEKTVFDLQDSSYRSLIKKWIKEEIQKYDKSVNLVDATLKSLEGLDGVHKVLKKKFVENLIDRWKISWNR